MKTYIKSLLAIATVALLGSSAQADNLHQAVTLKVGDTSDTYEMTYGTKTNKRWWKLAVKKDSDYDPSEAVASATFTSANPEEPRMTSSGTPAEVKCFFKALSAGTVKYVAYTFTDDPPYKSGKSYPAYATADGQSGAWSNGSGNDFTITVTDTPVPEGTLSIDSELEKGAKLSGVKFDNLEGKMIDTNKKEVEGTYAWKNGDETLQRGTAGYAATFTPTGTMAPYYDTVDVTIQVTAATPETIEPVFVKATRITFAEGATQSESQYEGFLTEKGCQYAWGKEDSPTTAWTDLSDGTPCDLPKPDDADQLFVKRPAK